MRELEALIRDIDREIERAFEETFEATARNFEEMVEHLFPGGRGALRRVKLRPVRDAPSLEVGEGRGRDRGGRGRGARGARESRSRSPRPASRPASSRCSRAARSRWSHSPSSSRSSSPGPAPSTSSTRSRPPSTTPTSTASCSSCGRFSDRAQFVIVTHQKRTMDAADVLYGVTMGDDGVTKVVSRRLPREDAAGRRRGAAAVRGHRGRCGRARRRRRASASAASRSRSRARRGSIEAA